MPLVSPQSRLFVGKLPDFHCHVLPKGSHDVDTDVSLLQSYRTSSSNVSPMCALSAEGKSTYVSSKDTLLTTVRSKMDLMLLRRPVEAIIVLEDVRVIVNFVPVRGILRAQAGVQSTPSTPSARYQGLQKMLEVFLLVSIHLPSTVYVTRKRSIQA